jgi:uncharacterized protein YydD (DUF2326 family)
MIRRVTTNQPTFKTVEFTPGFNVVWADRTKDSTKKDSRNGLGKSTLIEIIHFCLGASSRRGQGLMVKALEDWEFSADLEIGGKEVRASRSVRTPGQIMVCGEAPGLVEGALPGMAQTVDLGVWTGWLGQHGFGLPMIRPDGRYQPSFRALISYFIRRGKDGFFTPFEYCRKQKEWDKQVHNAFLLGLNWDDAAEFQVLKDRRNGLRHLRQAAEGGAVKGMSGTLGELEAQRVQLAGKAEQQEATLRSFRVHPDYAAISEQANRLTAEIHEAVNANTVAGRMVELYRASQTEEEPPADDALAKVYADAGVSLPGVTLRALAEVRQFHQTVIRNRRAFLDEETQRLGREVADREQSIREMTEERAGVMEILRTHGALEEYTLLQRRHLDTIAELNAVENQIANVKACESGLSQVKIDQELLLQKARRDFDERQPLRDKAIAIFNGYSEALYNAPGRLIIDPSETGFTFDIEIERSGSAGIGNMKIFCYDLMLTRLWSGRVATPGVLVHDSTIFDGVDERQRALALELAAAEAKTHGFQYICTLNSDYVPWSEFSPGFDPKEHIRLRLTDADVAGCLLGVRF